MKTQLPAAMAFALAALAFGVAPSVATDIHFGDGSWENRFNELEAEVVGLRREVANKSGGGGDCNSCGVSNDGGCGSCCCDPCALRCGWLAGMEIALLAPHVSNGTAALFGGPAIDTDYDPSWRMWLGFTRRDGLGFRARYWEYDNRTDGTGDAPPFFALDTYVLDFEVTSATPIGCYWDLVFSTGFRYVHYNEQRGTTPRNLVSDLSSDQTGMTIGAEIRRDLIGNLDLYTNFRGALVYGSGNEFVNNYHIEDRLGSMLEMQLGVEYSRETFLGLASFKSAFEGQYWSTFSDEIAFDGSGAIGFVGFNIGMTILR